MSIFKSEKGVPNQDFASQSIRVTYCRFKRYT